MATTKAQLREAMQSRLKNLDAQWRREASQRIAKRVWDSEIWQGAEVVGLFAGRDDEVDTSFCWTTEKKFLFPRTFGNEMDFFPVAALAELQLGRWGMWEPTASASGRPDVVLVPGLAFDRSGGRLGRGRGFYDRWLARHPTVAMLGVCFDLQMVEDLPMEAHDHLINAVATERAFYSTIR